MDLDAAARSKCPASTSRRQVLKTGAAVGTLLLGFSWPYGRARTNTRETFAPNAFIRIDRRGKVTLVMPQVEMGQGVYTAVAMILAEELSVSLEQVELAHAPPSDALYGNPLFHIQVTSNSNSIRSFWMTLRKAGATARAMLVEAAARRWSVQSTALTTSDGKVRQSSGRELAYGELVEVAGGITPPKDAPLKVRRDFQLIGRPLKRLDTPDKTTGAAIYGIDVMPAGVKFATLTACPVFGSKVGRVNDAKAMSVPAVRQVVVLDDLVAVVADHMWAAKQGLAALEIEWAEGANAHVTSAQVWQESNFNDYRMLRIDETPAIEVHLIDSDEAPGGIGETGTTAAPPALGNAIYAATGVRLRRLPIDRAALAEKNT
jgi:isoquinoline 1-oxidoreductase beta subunit